MQKMDHLLCREKSAIPSGYQGQIQYHWSQNMIVDATLMDGIELSHHSLDAVLGEPVTKIIWCWTYYPSPDKMLPSLFILSSTDIACDKYVVSQVKTLSSHRKLPSCQFSIQCKILIENCKG